MFVFNSRWVRSIHIVYCCYQQVLYLPVKLCLFYLSRIFASRKSTFDLFSSFKNAFCLHTCKKLIHIKVKQIKILDFGCIHYSFLQMKTFFCLPLTEFGNAPLRKIFTCNCKFIVLVRLIVILFFYVIAGSKDASGSQTGVCGFPGVASHPPPRDPLRNARKTRISRFLECT